MRAIFYNRPRDVTLQDVADIFPTGWHATRLAGLEPGERLAVWGSCPVGLMAACSAMLQGASHVFVVDRHPDRLRLAESIGVLRPAA
jgi:glutathione-independent formaldehyde dehydrogenase